MAKINVLSTKKLEPSLLQMAGEQGIVVTEQEAIQVKPILSKEKWQEIFSLLEKGLPYAVFTSSNAVLSLKKYLNEYVNYLPVQWKVFCLSGRTKEAILEQAESLFGNIEGTANDGAALAELIIQQGVKEVVFFCGNKRRDELPSILQSAGVTVHEVVVYETIETSAAVKEDYDAVLFFSPSAVQSFFALNQLKADTVCFAIGQTTADSLVSFTSNKICISNAPSQEAMLQEVINYFQNKVSID